MCCESPPFRFVPETQNCCNKSQCIRRRRLPPSSPPPKKKKPPRNWFSDSIWGGRGRGKKGRGAESPPLLSRKLYHFVPFLPLFGVGESVLLIMQRSRERAFVGFLAGKGGQLFRVEPGKTRTYFTQSRERPKGKPAAATTTPTTTVAIP